MFQPCLAGWLAEIKIPDRDAPPMRQHVSTMNVQGSIFRYCNMFFFFNDHVLTLWKRHELRTYLCSVLNVFGGAKVFQKMLNDEPAS